MAAAPYSRRLNLTRDQLSAFLTDQQQIRQFELLFSAVDELQVIIGTDFEYQADTAAANANNALAQISALAQDTAVNDAVLNAKVQQSLDAIPRLAQALELLALAPVRNNVELSHDVNGILPYANLPTNIVQTSTSMVADQSVWASGASTIDDDSGFTRTAAGGRYLFGAVDDTIGKVQINGSVRVQGAVYNGGNQVALTAGVSIDSESGITATAAAGGNIDYTAGAAPNDNSNGGNINFNTGIAGAITGSSGSLQFTIGALADGDAGAFTFLGTTGVGLNKVGTSALIYLGNADAPADTGIFTVTDLLGSGSMIYNPLVDTLKVGLIDTATSYSPGDFTVKTETWKILGNHVKLTTTQRVTLQGTGRLRLSN